MHKPIVYYSALSEEGKRGLICTALSEETVLASQITESLSSGSWRSMDSPAPSKTSIKTWHVTMTQELTKRARRTAVGF
jgi:hypothetical protein